MGVQDMGGAHRGGTHLAEELVVVLRDQQQAAAQRLGLLLQLGWGGDMRAAVGAPTCPEPPPPPEGRIWPLTRPQSTPVPPKKRGAPLGPLRWGWAR